MRASERRLLFIFWDLSVYHWNYTCRKANGWLTSVQKTGWNPHLLIPQTCSTERNNFNLFPSCFDTRRNLGVVWPKGLRTVRRKGTTSELVLLSCLLDWHECYPDVLWSRCRHLPIPKKYIFVWSLLLCRWYSISSSPRRRGARQGHWRMYQAVVCICQTKLRTICWTPKESCR